ncbi:MAG: Gfo/Idh/MocA family oxidoreductase, partial [Spirochaetales bacterium]|nr:Gfo/Idh/MocA family oxidoreductase [Spirochaetales bacterium]
TGIPSHRVLSTAALEAGYHVLCEKPAAGTYDEALFMRDAAKKAGNILAIGFQMIFTPAVQSLKTAALDERFGKLLEMKTRVLWPRGAEYFKRNGWAGRIKAGDRRIYDSPAQNATSHYLNTMLYVAGPSADESAYPAELYGENYRAKDIESADTQYLRVLTGTGIKISFIASHSSPESVGPVTQFIFEKGIIEFDASEKGETYRVLSGSDELNIELFPSQPPEKNRADVFDDVFEAIREGRAPLCSIENALPHVLCIQTLFEESCPVRRVDPQHVEILSGESSGEAGGNENAVIRSIVELTEKMFTEGTSFSEAGALWATPGRMVAPVRC